MCAKRNAINYLQIFDLRSTKVCHKCGPTQECAIALDTTKEIWFKCKNVLPAEAVDGLHGGNHHVVHLHDIPRSR